MRVSTFISHPHLFFLPRQEPADAHYTPRQHRKIKEVRESRPAKLTPQPMFYPHHQSQQSTTTSASKHHDSQDVRLPGTSSWSRHPSHPSFTPSLPMPSPSGYPPLGSGYPPPGGHHHPNVNVHSGIHGPHPSFGSGMGGNGGMGHGPGFGMGMFQNGVQTSPPRGEPVPMTSHWQTQMVRAEASRSASSPHHRARAAAISSRATNKPSAVPIVDPNTRPSSSYSTNGLHRKNASSVFNAEPTGTPPLSDPSLTPAQNPAEPATPAPGASLTESKEEEKPNEPWTGLDLGGIRLKRLSTALFSFTHVTSLYINHNALTSIPSAISSLRQLTLLDATGNELSTIPPEIGVLCKLKDLLLFDNNLTTLPFELGTLYQLDCLGIDGNPMNADYRKKLVEDGTKGLITYLRDHAPPPPPLQRDSGLISKPMSIPQRQANKNPSPSSPTTSFAPHLPPRPPTATLLLGRLIGITERDYF